MEQGGISIFRLIVEELLTKVTDVPTRAVLFKLMEKIDEIDSDLHKLGLDVCKLYGEKE